MTRGGRGTDVFAKGLLNLAALFVSRSQGILDNWPEHGLAAVLVGSILLCAVPGAHGSVVVARVDNNGSCGGLLAEGDRILSLNGTPIYTTSDVRAYLNGTLPNQTIIVGTDSGCLLVRLGGTSTGKLGIGMININRTLLFVGDADLPTQTPSPSPAPLQEDEARLPIGVALSVALSILLAMLMLSSRKPMQKVLAFFDPLADEGRGNLGRCFLLFGLSAIARLAFNLAYFLRFGWHAANVMELWFYVDVAQGHHYFLNPLSATIYVLRLFALASPEKIPFYSTVACSIALASLVPVLIYLLIKEVHGPKAGLLSGLAYGLLVQPLALSTTSFTQHITQIPFALLFILLLTRAIERRGRQRLAYSFALPLVGLLGYLINEEIFVYFLMGYLLIAIAIVRWFLASKGLDTGTSFAAMMLAVGLVALPVHLYFDEIAGFSVSLTPKEALNESAMQMVHPPTVSFLTAVPLPSISYLRLYGIYIILVPFGLYCCWGRKDPVPFLFLVLGVVTSLHWARGSRILDIGIAMLAGICLGGWKSEWSVAAAYISIPLLAGSLLFFPKSSLQPYLLLGIVGFLAVILPKRIPFKAGATIVLGISYCLAVFASGVIYVDPIKSTEAEFQALRWLDGNSQPGERILTCLDRGHLPDAITHLNSVSDEYDMNPEIAKAFYETEEMAAATLKEFNVSYVMVSSDDLTIGADASGQPAMSIRGYATFDQTLGDAEIPLTLVFRLTYPDPGLKYFEQVCVRTSDTTIVRIYKLRVDLLPNVERPSPWERTTLSLVLRNPNNEPVTTQVMISITDSSGNLRALDSIRLELGANEDRSLGCDYLIRPIPGSQLMVEQLQTRAQRPGRLPIRGFLEAWPSGLCLFNYTFADARSLVIHEMVGEGVHEFTHELDVGEGTSSLREINITPAAEAPLANGSVSISKPSEVLDPVQVIFREID